MNKLSDLYREIFTKTECANGNHYFIRYNDSNLVCKKCGRFAKIGYLCQKETDNETEVWNGYHGQVTVPKGTFEAIWNDCKEAYNE